MWCDFRQNKRSAHYFEIFCVAHTKMKKKKAIVLQTDHAKTCLMKIILHFISIGQQEQVEEKTRNSRRPNDNQTQTENVC